MLENQTNFTIQLNSFDGPLDLLDTLIREHKLDILNLDVSELTKQYLNFVNTNIEKLQVDETSEYLSMASYLIELKSKKVLPLNDINDLNNFEYERDRLVKRILEYKQYKLVAEQLLIKHEKRMEFVIKKPNDLQNYVDHEKQKSIKLPDSINVQKLLNSYKLALEKYHFALFKYSKILIQEISVESVQNDILNFLNLNNNKEVSFSEYLSSIDSLKFTFQYVITTFIALLELTKYQKINLVQKAFNDEIYFNNLQV